MAEKNVILIGMPGAGKSTVGVVLAKRLGYSFTDSDLVIAVNSDADAPIFHYCDYGLVADMDETCDALLRVME